VQPAPLNKSVDPNASYRDVIAPNSGLCVNERTLTLISNRESGQGIFLRND